MQQPISISLLNSRSAFFGIPVKTPLQKMTVVYLINRLITGDRSACEQLYDLFPNKQTARAFMRPCRDAIKQYQIKNKQIIEDTIMEFSELLPVHDKYENKQFHMRSIKKLTKKFGRSGYTEDDYIRQYNQEVVLQKLKIMRINENRTIAKNAYDSFMHK